MRYLVIMPAMVESVADPCIESLSRSVKNKTLIIDNSPEGFAWKHDINSRHYPQNIGVARAWNIGAKQVVDQKLDYLIILSASVLLNKGLDDFIEQLETIMPEYGLESQFQFHLIAISRKTIETIGYFDENFYPAYYEDSDYLRRLHIAGIAEYNGLTFPIVTVDATVQGTAMSIKKGGLEVNFVALSDYFARKWGSVFEYEQDPPPVMFQHPFDDPKNAIDYWQPRSIDELKKEYAL